MIKILVAEDDKALNNLVCLYLRNNGYAPTPTFNGKDALEAFEKENYALIISDIMMPELNGFELAESVRELDDKAPIIFMSAKDDKSSQMLGYRLGIDDYIVKPFDPDVLMLKVAALLRRAKIMNEQRIVLGQFVMDAEEHTAYLGDEELNLTVREFNLLFKLLSYPKKTFTRSALMAEFWDYDSSATSRTVDVYMTKLREKTKGCKEFEIVTVHGLGYKAVLK